MRRLGWILLRALPALTAAAVVVLALRARNRPEDRGGRFDLAHLDLRLNYWRHEAGRIESPPVADRVLVGTLSQDDQAQLQAITEEQWSSWGCDPALASVVTTDYLDDPREWRPLHACLLRRLAAAGASAVGMDVVFAEGGENTALKQAITEAKIPIILGEDQAHPVDPVIYGLPNVRPAVLSGLRDAWLDAIQVVPLADRTGDGRTLLPTLALQLFRAGREKDVRFDPERGVLYHELTGRQLLWLRYEQDAPEVKTYSELLLSPTLAKDRAVLLGIEGDWLQDDLRRIPIVNPRKVRHATDRHQEYGVVIHAYVFDQLVASLENPSAIPDEATGFVHWLLFALVFVIAALPGFVLWRWFVGSTAVFTRSDARLTPVQRLRVWPWPALSGPLLVLVVEAATWRVPYIYPLASLFATSLLVSLAFSFPGLLTWRAARHFIRALRQVESARRGRFGDDEIVRIPRGGLPLFRTLLSGPVHDPAALGELVRWLCFALVESDAGKTFFQRLPRRFFADRGWLEPQANQASVLEKPIERADQLTEEFVGTRLRRIRNEGVHVGLKVPQIQLAHAAFAAGGFEVLRPSPLGCLRFQLSTLAACTAYLEELARCLENPPEAKQGAA